MINRKLLLIVFLGIFILSCKSTQRIHNSKADQKMVYQDIAYLADDKLKGRVVGTPEELKAAKYIAQRFEGLGLKPAGTNGFYQDFIRKVGADPHSPTPAKPVKEVKARNVMALIDHGAAHTVIIGAHYDHLAANSPYSLHSGKPEVHNGADDNASGIAGMIELARQLRSGPTSNNYLFIAFTGEEEGLWGSNYFVKNPPIPLENINYMINMDMIGRLDTDRGLAIHATGTSPVWDTVIEMLKKQRPKLPIKKYESGIGPSDFTSFYLANIPCLSFFTGQHDDYHKPGDDIEKINFEGIDIVVDMIKNIINVLDDKGKLLFSKTKDQQEGKRSFKVTLGVIPDYLYDGNGMRIDGVKDKRPAAIAGMQKGDIVQKIGDIEINNMKDYIKALSSFEPGQKTIALIKRGDKTIELELEF